MGSRYEVREGSNAMAPPFGYQVVDTGQPDLGEESLTLCLCELREDAERIAEALEVLDQKEQEQAER